MHNKISNKLEFTTARLVVTMADGTSNIGTAFFVGLPADKDCFYPLLITNRHVIENGVSARFCLSKQNADGSPNYSDHVDVVINELNKKAIMHPNPDIDLCAISFGEYVNEYKGKGIDFHYILIGIDDIITTEEEKNVEALSDILMIGYPIGQWDKTNNMPIARKGIMATPIYLDYDGTPHFLMDIPVFPGSSGSPIFIYEENVYLNDKETYLRKDRVKLCGINRAVYNFEILGEEKTAFGIDETAIRIGTKIPTNIGVAIKASQLLYLLDHIKSNKLLN